MARKQSKKDSEGIGKKEIKKKKSSKARKSKSQEELNERRKREYELVLMGETQSNIAKQMGVSLRIIEKDIQKVREEGGKKFSLQQMLGKMHDYDSKAMRRIRELWKIVINAKSTNDEIIRALKEIRNEDTEAIKREQIAGILPKEVSPLVSVEATSKDGLAENKVQINIIAPGKKKDGD